MRSRVMKSQKSPRRRRRRQEFLIFFLRKLALNLAFKTPYVVSYDLNKAPQAARRTRAALAHLQASDGIWVGAKFFQRAFRDHRSAFDAGAGAQINDVI